MRVDSSLKPSMRDEIDVAGVCQTAHVIRQQLKHRGPRCRFNTLFLGARMAIMASSKTVFSPFWVKAEHST